ncbi:MAG: hypothetical protein JW862_01120 [Anaerolineales bacterium]|nr:hypothetical protein [Anaerolineales bacterium]
MVVTGCAHPGILEIVKKAQAWTRAPVQLVMGGFHLKDHQSAAIEQITHQLQGLGVKQVAPSHCTGDQARNLLADVYDENFIHSGVGKVIHVPE